LSYVVILILRINCFATLGDKMENKHRKDNFTTNAHVIILFNIKQGGKNKLKK
jgi:hypothetical protein